MEELSVQVFSNAFMSCMRLMSSTLFSRCAGTFFSMGSRALASNNEMCCMGPLMLDTIGLISVLFS